MMEGWSFEWKDFLWFGVFLLGKEFNWTFLLPNVHCYWNGCSSRLYHGLWVETVATVGVGAVEFTGVAGVWVVGMGWVITLTLYFPSASMVLHFFFFFFSQFGFWGFSGHGVIILDRCAGAWLWLGLGFGPGPKLTL